jgi:hypothetical protein
MPTSPSGADHVAGDRDVGAGGCRAALPVVACLAGRGLRLAYVVIFSVPVAQKTFMIDPSNVAIMSIALAIGLAGAAIIEVLWWQTVR